MRLDHDLFDIPYELLNFEAAHDTLHTLILDRMMSRSFRHVVAVLLLNVSSHLTLRLRHIVEYCCDRAGHVLTELQSLLLDERRADGISIAREYGIHIIGRVRADNLKTLEHIKFSDCLHTAINQELIQASSHNEQVFVEELVSQDGADLLYTCICNAQLVRVWVAEIEVGEQV